MNERVLIALVPALVMGVVLSLPSNAQFMLGAAGFVILFGGLLGLCIGQFIEDVIEEEQRRSKRRGVTSPTREDGSG